MKKLSGGSTLPPMIGWYQFKPLTPESGKLSKHLTKGLEIVGRFQMKWIKKVTSEDGAVYEYTYYFINTNDGTIALPGCAALLDLDRLEGGTPVKILFQGKGKPKPGRKPPYIFDIYQLTDEEYAAEGGTAVPVLRKKTSSTTEKSKAKAKAPAPDTSDEGEEEPEFDDEVPF